MFIFLNDSPVVLIPKAEANINLQRDMPKRLQQCWYQSVKPWMSHNCFCTVTPTNDRRWINTSPGFHISFRRRYFIFRFPPCHALHSHSSCNTVLQYEVLGFTWHNISYQHAITAEEKQSRYIWCTGRRAWDVCISRKKRRPETILDTMWWILNVDIMTQEGFL